MGLERELRTAFPTPREHHPMRRVDFDELAPRNVPIGDVLAELATRTGV